MSKDQFLALKQSWNESTVLQDCWGDHQYHIESIHGPNIKTKERCPLGWNEFHYSHLEIKAVVL